MCSECVTYMTGNYSYLINNMGRRTWLKNFSDQLPKVLIRKESPEIQPLYIDTSQWERLSIQRFLYSFFGQKKNEFKRKDKLNKN